MAKSKEITVVVELGDDGVLGVRSNVPGVKVIIADYDVPDEWDYDGLAPTLQVLEGEDNYFQKITVDKVTVDPEGVAKFVGSKDYQQEEDESDELPRFT